MVTVRGVLRRRVRKASRDLPLPGLVRRIQPRLVRLPHLLRVPVLVELCLRPRRLGRLHGRVQLGLEVPALELSASPIRCARLALGQIRR